MDKMSKFSIENMNKTNIYNQLKFNKNNQFDLFFLLFISFSSLFIFKNDFAGVSSLIFVSILTIVFTRIYLPIRKIIIIALTLRLLTISPPQFDFL